MKVSTWHGGQLAVAWVAGLLCASVMLVGFEIWDSRLETRFTAEHESLESLRRDNDVRFEQAQTLPPSLAATTELQRLNSLNTQILKAEMANSTEDTDHTVLKRKLAPIAWVTALGVVATLLVMSWIWFGSRTRHSST
ncbi:MAG TPA: hypothetical protein VGM82_03065 [Gemmatimonadaceae bacterium]|jgi:hypothetical protein